jgi:hypothetical protein
MRARHSRTDHVRVDMIGILALFLMAFVVLGKDPEEMD